MPDNDGKICLKISSKAGEWRRGPRTDGRSFSSFLSGRRLLEAGIPCPLALLFLRTTNHVQIMANVLGVGFWDFPGVKVGGQIDDATGKRGRKVVFLGVHENLQLSAYLVIVYFNAQLTHCGEQLVDAWLASCHGQPESNQELCGQAKAAGEMIRRVASGSALEYLGGMGS